MRGHVRPTVIAFAVALLCKSVALAQSVPGVPGNLAATVSGNVVTLTWTAPAGGAPATGYSLVGRLGAGAAPIVILPVGNVLSTAVTAPTGSYYVTVRATNQQGAGAESSGITVTVPSVSAAPGTPQNLSAWVNGSTVTLTWNASGAPAAAYTVAASTTLSGAPIAVFATAATTVSVGGVPAGTYYVRVSASNAVGTSIASDVLTVRAPQGSPTLSVTTVNPQSIGGTEIGSSTRLHVAWSVPSGPAVDHYELIAVDGVTGASTTSAHPAGVTSATVTDLKANTGYTIAVKACVTTTCTQYSGTATAASTAKEYWQLQGSGNTVGGLTQLVSDGNARLSATRFGPDAGAMSNRVQLYYGPRPSGSSQLAVAVSAQAADAANPASYLAFTSRAGASGLISPPTAATLVRGVSTGQGVPMSAGMGAKVRLFFEAQGADGKTRVLSLDSQDGFVGQDFNAGSATTCATATDYESAGCRPTVVIGLEGDAVAANAKISNARQHKLAWPTLDSAHWDGAAGTFLVFTVDSVVGCTTSGHNHAYAVWQGTSFSVQYGSSGCPKLFTSAQAAFPMHIGGVRYKMYYGDPSITTGRASTGNLPFLGPKKLIYADGQRTGAANTVDFEDWEAQTSARDVVFLWPNGDRLDDRAEGYIDDYHFLTPTGTLDLQVMYLTITDGVIVPISAAAILRNP